MYGHTYKLIVSNSDKINKCISVFNQHLEIRIGAVSMRPKIKVAGKFKFYRTRVVLLWNMAHYQKQSLNHKHKNTHTRVFLLFKISINQTFQEIMIYRGTQDASLDLKVPVAFAMVEHKSKLSENDREAAHHCLRWKNTQVFIILWNISLPRSVVLWKMTHYQKSPKSQR